MKNEQKKHVNQSKLNFSCGAGEAKINIFTGDVEFVSSDLNIGVGGYRVEVFHVYTGHAKLEENYVGNRWKLNLEEYIEEIEDATGKIYLYTDAYGYTHEFERYETKDGYEKYFDRTGLGLTLKVKSGETYIEDVQGGKRYLLSF